MTEEIENAGPTPECGTYDEKFQYPPTLAELKEERRSYCDEAAAAMFVKAGGRKLQQSATQMATALNRQAENLVQYHSSPFTEQHMQTMKVTLEALERTQQALQEWHWTIYPNQRPRIEVEA